MLIGTFSEDNRQIERFKNCDKFGYVWSKNSYILFSLIVIGVHVSTSVIISRARRDTAQIKEAWIGKRASGQESTYICKQHT